MENKKKVFLSSKNDSVSLRLKLIILFIDFYIYQGSSAVSYYLLDNPISEYQRSYPILFGLIFYVLYYTLPELFFRRTLGMRFLGVILTSSDSERNSKTFLSYSLLVYIDRMLFLIIYIFRVLFSLSNQLLISEKVSGWRWVKKRE